MRSVIKAKMEKESRAQEWDALPEDDEDLSAPGSSSTSDVGLSDDENGVFMESPEILMNALFLLELTQPSIKQSYHPIEPLIGCKAKAPTDIRQQPRSFDGQDEEEKKTSQSIEAEWKGRNEKDGNGGAMHYQIEKQRDEGEAVKTIHSTEREKMERMEKVAQFASNHSPSLNEGRMKADTNSLGRNQGRKRERELDEYGEEATASTYPTRKRKRPVERKRASQDQVDVLERMYSEDKFPSSDLIRKTGERLGMKPSKVKNWFQNKRAKERRTSSGKEIVKEEFGKEKKCEKEKREDFGTVTLRRQDSDDVKKASGRNVSPLSSPFPYYECDRRRSLRNNTHKNYRYDDIQLSEPDEEEEETESAEPSYPIYFSSNNGPIVLPRLDSSMSSFN